MKSKSVENTPPFLCSVLVVQRSSERVLSVACVIHGTPQRMNGIGLHIDVCDSPPRVTG